MKPDNILALAAGETGRAGQSAALERAGRLLIVVSAPGLKTVNRLQGLDAGDALLSRIGKAVTGAAPGGCAMRLTGAKFAAVLPAASEEEALAELCRFYDDLAARLPGVRLHLGAAWAEQPLGREEVVSCALSALDRARSGGPQGFECVVAGAAEDDDMRVARAALAAIRAGAASLAMQTIVDTESPGRVMFREALIRLRSPDGAEIPAARFMPALNRLGVAAEADIAALEMAAEAMARDPALRVSVNISADGLTRPGWRAVFADIAARSPDIAERLIVEINEDAACEDIDAALDLFLQLRARGTALALDDFGGGRTSFRHLRDLRFDMVKIDGEFIRGIDRSPNDQALVDALVGLARRFDMMIVAECVETAQEARVLRRLGVDGLQGFLFGRPTLVWSEGETVARAAG